MSDAINALMLLIFSTIIEGRCYYLYVTNEKYNVTICLTQKWQNHDFKLAPKSMCFPFMLLFFPTESVTIYGT